MAEMAMGFRFEPTLEQIYIYLYNKIYKINEENVGLDYIKELNLYEASPSDLQGLSNEEYTYLFTLRNPKKRSGGTNIDRQTKDGKGCWLMEDSDYSRTIKKTLLVYHLHSKKGKGIRQKTNWIMHEYALTKLGGSKPNEMMALCGIYENKPTSIVTEKILMDLTLQLCRGDQKKNTPKLPMGFRFSPTEEEIFAYLRWKVSSPKVFQLDYIKDLDLYEVSPFDLLGLSKEGYTYFFTPRYAIKRSGTNINRRTRDGKGSWLKRRTKKYSVGTRNLLVYYLDGKEKGMKQKTNWIMHEFAVKRPEQVYLDKETVLCRVYEREVKGENLLTEHEIDRRRQDGNIVINESEQECRQNDEAEQSQHSNTTSTA